MFFWTIYNIEIIYDITTVDYFLNDEIFLMKLTDKVHRWLHTLLNYVLKHEVLC